jgi:hypothetical protein
MRITSATSKVKPEDQFLGKEGLITHIPNTMIALSSFHGS